MISIVTIHDRVHVEISNKASEFAKVGLADLHGNNAALWESNHN
jgi:hypothetical protein